MILWEIMKTDRKFIEGIDESSIRETSLSLAWEIMQWHLLKLCIFQHELPVTTHLSCYILLHNHGAKGLRFGQGVPIQNVGGFSTNRSLKLSQFGRSI